jgi:hypothetical protein
VPIVNLTDAQSGVEVDISIGGSATDTSALVAHMCCQQRGESSPRGHT